MTRSSLGFLIRAADLLKRQVPRLDDHELKQFVQSFLDRRGQFLSTIEGEELPLYIVDVETLRDRAKQFCNAFRSVIPDLRVYYAMKSNSHPLIADILVKEGLGLDVSSGLELSAALNIGTKDIIFSGPGKRPSELKLAVDNSESVTILLDSFNELIKLEQTAGQSQKVIRAGVRLTSDESGIWKKFGIPLDRLSEFFEQAQKCKWINLCGLQFHLSWNLNAEAQVVFIARLSAELRRLNKKHREQIRFIDIGGGFWPEEGEWLQPAATPHGMLRTALVENDIQDKNHYKRNSSSITDFASHISAALKKQLPEDIKCTICLEPGRWLCHRAMHILLTVIDKKSSDNIITDGGTNAVGWERFEADYFPVINLTHPGLKEHECLVAGSLCTPHDIWGYSYFGDCIKEGDILLIPNQGAYTYSLRQEFIKPLPQSIVLKEENKSFKKDRYKSGTI